MSPYAFIADEIWDHAAALAAEEDFSEPMAEGTIASEVSMDDLCRAPIVPLLQGQQPVAAVDHPNSLLAKLTGPLRVRGAIWPFVDRRLCVLVFLQGRGERFFEMIDEGLLETCLSEATAIHNGQSLDEALQDWRDLLKRVRQKRHSGEGIALFQCSQSGKIFGTYVLA